MKKILAIALISVLVLVGCKETQNDIAAIVNPIIGTWTSTVLGFSTVIVFNADKSCTETTTILGVGVTNNGTWTSTDAVITRARSDDTIIIQNYSFNSDSSQLTLSSSESGIATTYTKS